MFEKLIWQKDRMLLDNLVFRLQHYKNDDWELGDNCFIFFKIKTLVDQYANFFALRQDFHPENILELGMWDGGSVAFWFEYFKPKKHVGIDIQRKPDSPYFRQYIVARGLTGRIKTYWATDQADTARLREIVRAEFSTPLDLIIDDASHMYSLTKTSFETLFPLLRPGGLYIIEDWAWGHWKEFQAPDHPWAKERTLTKLIFELVEATGTGCSDSSQNPLIANLTIFQGFTVVEHGSYKMGDSTQFRLEDFISRRSELSPALQTEVSSATSLSTLKKIKNLFFSK